MDKVATELTRLGAAKQANSDALVIQRYLLALGVDVTAERLNDLLVLLSALVVEVGGSLALAVGMALSEPGRPLDPATASELDQARPVAPPASVAVAIPTLAEPARKPQHGWPRLAGWPVLTFWKLCARPAAHWTGYGLWPPGLVGHGQPWVSTATGWPRPERLR